MARPCANSFDFSDKPDISRVVVYGNSYTCGLVFYNTEGDKLLQLGLLKDRRREFKLKQGQYFIGGKTLPNRGYVYDFEPRILNVP